ncbi:helix-turn-helix domain-containing protein [Virgibacillus kimchii]
MEFGAVLRRMRKGADMSQEALAEKLHLSRSNISKLESNKLELKAADLVNWCRVTNNPDILIAFVYGMDVLAGTTQFISTILLGGII